MDGGLDQGLRIRVARKLVDMHDQGNRIVSWKFLGPADNKLLGIVIEILLLKGRRVHRVEELLDSINGNLDPVVRFLV